MNKFTIILEQEENELSPEQKIKNAWTSEETKDKFEFYHKMRIEGYDGEVILSSIGE